MSRNDFLKKYEANRQRCEIWTRVMGYHRPVHTFNLGKQGEHAERLLFEEETQSVARRE